MITIYTKAHCHKCEDIKKRLKDGGVAYAEQSTEDRQVMQALIAKLTAAGLKNPLLPVLEFADGSLVSNDLGLLKELKQRGIL